MATIKSYTDLLEQSFEDFLALGMCGLHVCLETGETQALSPGDIDRVMRQPNAVVKDLSFEQLEKDMISELWY